MSKHNCFFVVIKSCMENSHSKLTRKVTVVPDFMNNKSGLIYKLAATLKRDVTIYYVCIFKLQTCTTHFI